MSDLKTDENSKKCHQGFQLKHFKRTTRSVQEQYLSSVANICTNVEERFSNMKNSAILENIESILDFFTWPVNGDCSVFGNDAIKKISAHLKSFLLRTAVISQKFLVSGLC